MKKALGCLSVFVLVCSVAANTFAITWFPKDFTCPIDSEKNTFLVVGSYGSYIYSYPSKYQWLFFPQTDSPTYYICKKCHLTTYMWDFDNLPKEKFADIKAALKGVKVSKAFKEYTDLSVTERLEIMEKVYSVLGKDDDWWEAFYRVKGYHYGKDGETAKASDARKRSLELIQKKLKKGGDSPQKLLYYMSGSMKHFLNDDKGAIEDLEKALATKFAEKDATAEAVKEAEAGLNERLTEYIGRIRSSDKKPRLFDVSSSDEH
jgi:hypothetical protein